MRLVIPLLCVLLCAGSLLAQSNQPAPISGSVYPGTPFSFSTTISNQGAPVSLSIVVTDRPGGKPVKSENQPTLTQTGNTVYGSWTAAQTLRLYQNRSVWVALFANGTAIRAGLYEFSYSTRPTRPGEVVALQLYSGLLPSEVYTRSQTDAVKPSITAVSTFAAAQALSMDGKPAIYLITADEVYGMSVTYWNGTSYYSSPLVPRNQ